MRPANDQQMEVPTNVAESISCPKMLLNNFATIPTLPKRATDLLRDDFARSSMDIILNCVLPSSFFIFIHEQLNVKEKKTRNSSPICGIALIAILPIHPPVALSRND